MNLRAAQGVAKGLPYGSHELLTEIATYHTQEHKWRFPDGGMLEFSYCDSDGEDHAPDALRYGLMSRSAPKALPAASPPGDFTGAAMFEIVTRRRRSHYIGHEREWEQLVGSNSYEQAMRLLHPPRLRGPSDR